MNGNSGVWLVDPTNSPSTRPPRRRFRATSPTPISCCRPMRTEPRGSGRHQRRARRHHRQFSNRLVERAHFDALGSQRHCHQCQHHHQRRRQAEPECRLRHHTSPRSRRTAARAFLRQRRERLLCRDDTGQRHRHCRPSPDINGTSYTLLYALANAGSTGPETNHRHRRHRPCRRLRQLRFGHQCCRHRTYSRPQFSNALFVPAGQLRRCSRAWPHITDLTIATASDAGLIGTLGGRFPT